MLEHSVH